MMDREAKAKNARAFSEAVWSLFRYYNREDFDLSLTLDDTLDPTDCLDIHRAAFLYECIVNATVAAQDSVRARQEEMDNQVITRGDLRQWLEGRK